MFMTWSALTGQVVEYPEARIEDEFRWLRDGKGIFFAHGDRTWRFDSQRTVWLNRLNLETREVERIAVRNPHAPSSELPWSLYPKALWDSVEWFDWCEHQTRLLERHGSNVCLNPRTGDLLETRSDPLGLHIRKANTQKTVLVARICPKGWFLITSPWMNWTPRWLRDDRHALVNAKALRVVDTATGRQAKIMDDVSKYFVLDRDLHRMYVEQMRLRQPGPGPASQTRPVQ
jgi:hypothetical protein